MKDERSFFLAWRLAVTTVLLRMGIAGAASLGAALVTAVAVSLLDLYLTGHGYGSITGEIMSRPSWGVHLSIGDIFMLSAAVAAGGLTWRSLRHGA